MGGIITTVKFFTLGALIASVLLGCKNANNPLKEFNEGKIAIWRNQINEGNDIKSEDCVDVLKLSGGFLEFALIKNDNIVWLDYWGGGATKTTRDEYTSASKADGRITEIKLINKKIEGTTLDVQASSEDTDLNYFFKLLNNDIVLKKVHLKPKKLNDQKESNNDFNYVYKTCRFNDLGSIVLQGNKNFKEYLSKSVQYESSENNNVGRNANNNDTKNQSGVPISPFPYLAVISCGMNGWQNINVYGCFSGRNFDTEIELRNGKDYGLYKLHNIAQSFKQTRNGLEIPLRSSFELRVQNSDDLLKLGVRIFNISTNEVVFQKQVGQFGVISVSN